MSDPSKRILVLTIRAIGDVALMTPIFRLLKETFPACYLAALADGLSAQVLHHNPHIDRLFTIDRIQSRQLSWVGRMKEWGNLVANIRGEQFDIVIDLFSGPRSAILAWLSGAPVRYGEDVRKGLRGFLYSQPIKVGRDGRHLVEQKLDLIGPLVGHVKREATYLELYPTEEEQTAADLLITRNEGGHRKRVGLIPGAGSRWRIWPAERFAELGDLLIKEYDVDIYLLGGKDEIPVCRRVESLMEKKAIDLSGKTTLRELIALLGRLDLVISNVTGPMHLASAFSKPRVIGLYGEADTVQYAPWGNHVCMLTKGEVKNAYWDKVNYQRDHEVLRQITVTDVFEAVKKVMKNQVGK
jgi:lipopolysaccharide heptosyltransferase II